MIKRIFSEFFEVYIFIWVFRRWYLLTNCHSSEVKQKKMNKERKFWQTKNWTKRKKTRSHNLWNVRERFDRALYYIDIDHEWVFDIDHFDRFGVRSSLSLFVSKVCAWYRRFFYYYYYANEKTGCALTLIYEWLIKRHAF